ncbi:MAG: L,D-transpeptidase [Eubacterium sp.]|nr:L,D-transpeptidase [Eubacterium sp.]
MVAYLSMAYFAQFYFSPGSRINGTDYSFKSPLYAEELEKENPSEYKLEIIFRDGKQVIKGSEIGLVYDYLSSLNDIKESQNPFLWFSNFDGKDYKIGKTLSFKEDLLESRIEKFTQLNPDKMISPENPIIEMNDEGIVVATIKEAGTTIEDIDGLKTRIKEAISHEETSINVEEEGFYKGPQFPVESYKVQQCLEYCNNIANLKIYYIYGDVEIPFTRRQLYDTIAISETYGAAISKNATEAVLKRYSWLHDTYDKDRVFRTYKGKYINVHGEYYGWQINLEEETDLLYSDLIHQRNVSRTPVFSYEGTVYTKEEDDIGDTYVEVDLENQHVYLYLEGKMTMEADCVTGCVNRGNATPPGLYYIYYKQSPSLLTGGETPVWVDYWMPFNRGIGLHDASWRWKFGEDIYVSNGSHGCVNLPLDFARDLYFSVDAGTPVVVY